jgi:hypothetical protein
MTFVYYIIDYSLALMLRLSGSYDDTPDQLILRGSSPFSILTLTLLCVLLQLPPLTISKWP